MTNHTADREAFLEQVQAAIDADRQNARKWQPLYDWFESRFGVRGGRGQEVGAKLLTEDKQLSNRIRKELGEFNSIYVVLSALQGVSIDDAIRFLQDTNLPRLKCVVILRATQPADFLVASGAEDTVVARLEEMFRELTPRPVLPAPIKSDQPLPKTVESAGPVSLVSIVIDDRVRRMVRLAIASSAAVILVGPPGTGKTTLLRQTINEMEADPASFGFNKEIEDPKWETPEESWTTRELIGGETVDEKGRLRFRPGHVLDAIRADRWLVLDETNRADMDKIFGGLLTWLSGQDVELGKASTNLDSPVVTLEWGDEPGCSTEGVDQLEAEDPAGGKIRFVAGTEWRLLGTYNALDAQRVFRFGEALGRRFARVPIPCPTREEFRTALEPLAEGLPDEVDTVVEGLYASHYETAATLLGPGLFMRIPEYVRRGLQLTLEPAAASPDDQVRRLLAEGYLVHVGPWLARLEPADLDHLKQRVTVQEGALDESDWDWISDLLPALGRLS
jgi:hypothetical protein